MRKKKVFIIAVILLLVIAAMAFKKADEKEQKKVSESAEMITAGDNQEIISGQITAINGNEIMFSTESGDELTMLIPVGTSVYTKLGTTTTFKRLAAGDQISVLAEEDGAKSIIEVWITA